MFIVGLSAGGAMAAAMLAAYPDLFAAGASVAGLPVGAARSGMQAMLRMASAGPERSTGGLGSSSRPPRRRDSPDHGRVCRSGRDSRTRTVAPENATLLTTQWRALHGLTAPATAERVRQRGAATAYGRMRRSRLVETGRCRSCRMPIRSALAVVVPGRFVEPAPVDATAAIGRFFGLD